MSKARLVALYFISPDDPDFNAQLSVPAHLLEAKTDLLYVPDGHRAGVELLGSVFGLKAKRI